MYHHYTATVSQEVVSFQVLGVLFKQSFTIFLHKNNKKTQATHKNKKGFQCSGFAKSLMKAIF